jgi:hypothetical protein
LETSKELFEQEGRHDMRKTVLIAICCILLIQGCAAVLVGGLFYQSTSSKAEKRKFMVDLRATNVEREKAGLEPLDLCHEIYMFDKGWAWEHEECRHLFEQDTTATHK